MADKLISIDMIPNKEGEVVKIDGVDYLVMNDAMFTFYKRSQGEFTPFFLGLRDDRKILGAKCTNCGLVRIPPFLTRCPDCNFAPTELIEVGQVGKMLSTPPITYFANSLFQEQVPFGRGRVVLEGADTAMSVNVYTTRGILVPGIVKKGTEMKVVFRDNRIGEITDIFCVPASELTTEQVAKKGLLNSELDWESALEPTLPAATPNDRQAFQEGYDRLKVLAGELSGYERARRDIADWHRRILVKSRGGVMGMEIDDGALRVSEGTIANPDFVMVSDDVSVLVNSLNYKGSLTQAIITRDLWISKNVEFTTIFKLERMARSLARSRKA